jgi:hypothetical protein
VQSVSRTNPDGSRPMNPADHVRPFPAIGPDERYV